jgi:DNA-binding XRE family transcriptional regulator
MEQKCGKTRTLGVCDRIKEVRGSMKMTQLGMAKALGWSRRRYVEVESGRGRLSLEELGRIIDLLGLVAVLMDIGYLRGVLPPSGEKDV